MPTESLIQKHQNLALTKSRGYSSLGEFNDILLMIRNDSYLGLAEYFTNGAGKDLNVNNFTYKGEDGEDCKIEHLGSLLTYALVNSSSSYTIRALIENSNVDLAVKLNGESALTLVLKNNRINRATICQLIVDKLLINNIRVTIEERNELYKLYKRFSPRSQIVAKIKYLFLSKSQTTISIPDAIKESIYQENSIISEKKTSAAKRSADIDSTNKTIYPASDVEAASILFSFRKSNQHNPQQSKKPRQSIEFSLDSGSLKEFETIAIDLEKAILKEINILNIPVKICDLVSGMSSSSKQISSYVNQIRKLTGMFEQPFSEIYRNFGHCFPISFNDTIKNYEKYMEELCNINDKLLKNLNDYNLIINPEMPQDTSHGNELMAQDSLIALSQMRSSPKDNANEKFNVEPSVSPGKSAFSRDFYRPKNIARY
jgi:hypothetical protein